MSNTPDEQYESALTYSSYLAVDELLQLQRPLSEGPEHDEMLFIIIHQTYELWFKQLIHEFVAAQQSLEAGDTHRSLAILPRTAELLQSVGPALLQMEPKVPRALLMRALIWVA